MVAKQPKPETNETTSEDPYFALYELPSAVLRMDSADPYLEVTVTPDDEGRVQTMVDALVADWVGKSNSDELDITETTERHNTLVKVTTTVGSIAVVQETIGAASPTLKAVLVRPGPHQAQ